MSTDGTAPDAMGPAETAPDEGLRRESEAVWATAACFAAGALLGTLVLLGEPRPLTGEGSASLPAAAVAGVVAAAAFVVSTLRHRRRETAPMPPWQTIVSDASAVALTIAFAAVVALGVLLASRVLAVGLEGITLPAFGGGLVTGTASAFGGRVAYAAGVGLRTRDLATLLFAFLAIGALFAMLTARDPDWWSRNFSQLGLGAGGWAFNGTLVVAGLLTATVGSYIGRDAHRLLGDGAIPRIAWTVGLWAATGAALATVGLVPVQPLGGLHLVAAFGSLALFGAAAIATTWTLGRPPRALVVATAGLGILLVAAIVLWRPVGLYSATGLEAIAVGLGLVWMTTFVRMLAVLAPEESRPSARGRLLGG